MLEYHYKDKEFEFKVENGIAHYIWGEGVVVTKELAEKSCKIKIEYLGNRSLPGLSDPTRVKYVHKAARDYLWSPKGVKCVSAGAILMSNTVSAIMANSFHFLGNFPFPARSFTKKDKALKWLEKFRTADMAEDLENVFKGENKFFK